MRSVKKTDLSGDTQSMETAVFLPTTREEMRALSIDQLDVLLVTGDAYVDHPAFGAGLVGRYLQSLGLIVGIIAMPDVKDPGAFTKLGAPRYFFGVTSGNVDSMVSLFTAQKKKRSDDPYLPGGKAGSRPERAIIAYCNGLKRVYKNVPIIIGGVEASLRRIVHYDYWSDSIRQPVLLDAKADMLVYGMAEKPLGAIVAGLKAGKMIGAMTDIPGTVIRLGKNELSAVTSTEKNIVRLPSYEEVKQSKQVFSEMTRIFYENISARMLQQSGTCAVLINPAPPPLLQKEFDGIYGLPFLFKPHPSYKDIIPACEQIKDSVTVVRGCLGGCNFCGLGVHQGKAIQSRSFQSVEMEIIRRVGALKQVKHLAINSGIRMDLALLWPGIIDVLARCAVGGHLSVAPEHVSPKTLRNMGKPENTGWKEFDELFAKASKRAGKKQYLSPYLIAGHPGSTQAEAGELRDYLKRNNLRVRQVQEFIPFPMTVSASMYYTGEDPFTKEKVEVSYKLSDTRHQKELIMWWDTPKGRSR